MEPTDEAGSRRDDIRESIEAMLEAHADVGSREEFDEIGPPEDVTRTLRAIYRDEDVSQFERTRALSFLRFYPTEETRELYESVLTHDSTPDSRRRIVVKAYGHAFGERAVALLADFLGHDDYDTRDAAVRALAKIGTERANELLRERLDDEPAEAIRERIRSQVEPSEASSD